MHFNLGRVNFLTDGSLWYGALHETAYRFCLSHSRKHLILNSFLDGGIFSLKRHPTHRARGIALRARSHLEGRSAGSKCHQPFHSHWINTMNRCDFLAILAASLAMAAVPVAAQMLRNFPATALRGELQIVQPPELLLNGRPARLAPGARIRGPDNLLQVSGTAVGQRLLVNYTLDANGNLLDVWILNAGEALRRPWPTSPTESARWRFDAAAQTWSKP